MLTTVTFIAHKNGSREEQYPTLIHALSSALNDAATTRHAKNAQYPLISLGNSVHIEFGNVEEAIRDIARNRATLYDMSRWELTGRNVEEILEGTMAADTLIQWIVDSINMISGCAYAYDRHARRGTYSFNMDVSGGYQFKEKD